MNMVSDPHNVVDWLKNAQYFNRLWHECLDFLNNEPSPELSDVERFYYHYKAKLLLQQKLNSQITALNLVYEQNDRSAVVLEIDHNEKGINQDGVFYGLYPADYAPLACHIPKDELLANLTQKQCEFFGII